MNYGLYKGSFFIPGNGDIFLPPPSLLFRVTTSTDPSGHSITAYAFNEDTYNVTPTNNGAGVGSVAKSYGDGWNGKGYNNLFTGTNRGSRNGVKCYGFTLQYVNADGSQNISALAQANTTLLTANLIGRNQIPLGMPLNQGIRNTMYQTGIMTVFTKFTLNSLSQISFNVPIGLTASLIVLCEDPK